MKINGKPDTDAITKKSYAYIIRWQKAQAALNGAAVPFGSLPVGAKFTLPGGRCQQVKLTCNVALAGGYVVDYWPWERVVAV